MSQLSYSITPSTKSKGIYHSPRNDDKENKKKKEKKEGRI